MAPRARRGPYRLKAEVIVGKEAAPRGPRRPRGASGPAAAAAAAGAPAGKGRAAARASSLVRIEASG